MGLERWGKLMTSCKDMSGSPMAVEVEMSYLRGK